MHKLYLFHILGRRAGPLLFPGPKDKWLSSGRQSPAGLPPPGQLPTGALCHGPVGSPSCCAQRAGTNTVWHTGTSARAWGTAGCLSPSPCAASPGYHQLGTAQLSGNRPRSQDSPFCVSFVEQTSVEIWKLSRADTVKPDAPPPTRNEDPERSLGSGRFLVEGSARYELASSSFLLSPCKQSTSHRRGTPPSSRAAPREGGGCTPCHRQLGSAPRREGIVKS